MGVTKSRCVAVKLGRQVETTHSLEPEKLETLQWRVEGQCLVCAGEESNSGENTNKVKPGKQVDTVTV